MVHVGGAFGWPVDEGTAHELVDGLRAVPLGSSPTGAHMDATERGARVSDVDELRAKLVHARERLEAAHEAMRVADRREEDARELGGGIPGFGGSGNQRAARQVKSALDSSYRAWKDATERIEKWTYRVKSLERRIAEQERPRLTRDDVVGAVAVHDGWSWRRVVRVNQKTVSVVNAHLPEWEPERIPFDKVRDVRRKA